MAEKNLEAMRHSCAHILAAAVLEMFPEAKLGIGPTIEDGFYYDFDLPRTLIPEDLAILEDKMHKVILSDVPFEKQVVTVKNALKLVQKSGQPYKAGLIKDLPADNLSFYKMGKFVDLCAGPHVSSTGKIGPFKLLSIAGAYWRGKETNPMLQRIYGTCFATQKELDIYLKHLELVKEFDHRKIGRELGLFSLHPESAGMPLWHPKGLTLINEIIKFWRAVHSGYGYEEIKTPQILDKALWQKSGHLDNYEESMFFTQVENQQLALKPMNCPGAILYYQTAQHSYRELPLKVNELGLVHRRELSGVLHGLFRVREITIDDAHIFCAPDQIVEQISEIIEIIVKKTYPVFGLKVDRVELSTRPAKSIGSDDIWQMSEDALVKALKVSKIKYQENPGEGAFYGPKIDFHVKDRLKRTWQLGTIQLDFSMPERFNLSFVGEDSKKHRPVIIHRAALGSLERFVGILLEHFGGNLPLWLAPVQLQIIPIGSAHRQAAKKLAEHLNGLGLRADFDVRAETVGRKTREAELQKIPYMLFVGDKELKSAKLGLPQQISIRNRAGGNIGCHSLKTFMQKVTKIIAAKKINF